MTDHNANKIDLEDPEKSTPDGRDPLPEATSTEGSVPERSGTLCPDLPYDDETTAISSGMPIPNPFDDAAGATPLEDELRDLAAHDSGVQLTETYRVCVGTPSPLPLAASAGSQEREDRLACIGMAVRVTRTIEMTGVPASEAPAIDMGHTPTQTITTHQEARGVIVGVLDNSPVDEPPQSSEPLEGDDLYEINTEFTVDLLRDGGGEALAQLVETYKPTSGSPLDFQDVPAIELDCNQLDWMKAALARRRNMARRRNLMSRPSGPRTLGQSISPMRMEQRHRDGERAHSLLFNWSSTWSSIGRNGDRNTRHGRVPMWQRATHQGEGVSLREA